MLAFLKSKERHRLVFNRPIALASCLIFLLETAAGPCHSQDAENTKSSPKGPASKATFPDSQSAGTAGANVVDAAMGLYREAKYEEAAAAFGQVAQSDIANAPKALAWQARADLKLGRVSDAEICVQKALSLAENLPTVRVALGEVYFRQGKFYEAEKEFLVPLKAGITAPRAYLGEARIAWSASNYKHAKQLIDKAHALDSQDPDIARLWFSTLSQAERAASMATASKPGSRGTRDSPNTTLDIPSDHQCRLLTPVASTEAALENLMIDAQSLRGFGLSVKVNGNSSRLLLDTGMSGVMLGAKQADRAGVLRVRDAKIGGVGNEGAASGYVAYAKSIQVGSLEFAGCLIRVIDKKRVMGEDGYIGADVFQNFLVEINFPDRKLKLSGLPKAPDSSDQVLGLQSDENAPPFWHDRYIAPEMQSYERFYRFGHQILLPTLVNSSSNSRLFLIDTGSYETHLSIDFARQVTKVHNDEVTRVRGFNGKVENVYRADRVTLGFVSSKLMQQANDVVALDLTDLSDSVGTEVSGIIGFSLLWLLDITIDYRDGLVKFTYDPHRLH